jgi:putative Mg2+ transporter-C (MgtC) family protein
VNEWELALRILVAAIAGLVLGYERQRGGHPAGIRTHSLVAIGACLFTIAGAYGFTDLTPGAAYDPARTAAQVVSGIGFLGAGAILRYGASIRGLTTAATLWIAAALGLAAGTGMYLMTGVALASTAAILMIAPMKKLLSRFRRSRALLTLEYRIGHGTMGPLLRGLESAGSLEFIRILDEDLDDRIDDGIRHLVCRLRIHSAARLDALASQLKSRPEVVSVQLDYVGTKDAGMSHASM